MIEQRRRDGDADQREDLLSRFMALRDESGEPLSDSDLRDVVMSFIIAGRDTTANMLTWTFFELSRQPAIAAKLRAQLDAALPDRQPPTYSDISEQNLPYAHAVVQETLRLHPSVPKDGKTAVRRDVLPNGVVVPAASVVLYFPWGMGRMPSLWGADACQYRPERWLEGAPAPSDFKYIAFNAGLPWRFGDLPPLHPATPFGPIPPTLFPSFPPSHIFHLISRAAAVPGQTHGAARGQDSHVHDPAAL